VVARAKSSARAVMRSETMLPAAAIAAAGLLLLGGGSFVPKAEHAGGAGAAYAQSVADSVSTSRTKLVRANLWCKASNEQYSMLTGHLT
jgi:hypothetical protein